jgi:hypothetical protein
MVPVKVDVSTGTPISKPGIPEAVEFLNTVLTKRLQTHTAIK